MKKKRRERGTIFTIGFKLVVIVSLIVLVSLGSITILVSWLGRQDLQVAAEANNFDANRRSAAEAEETLSKMRSDALILINTVSTAGDLAQDNTNFFFRHNPRIAAVLHSSPVQPYYNGAELLVNEQFFLSRDIDLSLADSFTEKHRITLALAAAGEATVLNAAVYFETHLLAMFFPGYGSGVGVLFSPENLNISFSSGVNQSWMINSAGDILIHSDFENVRAGLNVADVAFIRDIQESPHRSMQALIRTDFGVAERIASDDFFTRTWEAISPAWETVRDGVIWLFDTCADFILGLLRINRPASQREPYDAPETVQKLVAYTKLTIGGSTVITSIEYDMVFEGIAATTRRNIFLTFAVLSISIIFVWFFAKRISIPLQILAAVARDIEGGEFDVKLKSRGRDEIGVLMSSFQKMGSALRIFGKFTNREIALKAMRGEIKPGGLPKHATVFFSDIRGFTAKSETFTKVFGEEGASDRIVHWLNEYFTEMINCIEKTNGTIDKFIGDAVMAHWGTSYSAGSPARDAINCVTAALMMRKSLYELNRKRKKNDNSNPSITIGCGINTGIVTAGQLGSDMRMEYTVIGDSVNLASRIESLTKALGADILISEDTWNFVKTCFITEEMPSVTVKGKEKPVRVFAVVNIAGTNKGPQTLNDVRKLLGIEIPVLGIEAPDGEEKKYKILNEKKQE